LRRLDPAVAQRIIRAVDRLAVSGLGDILRLHGTVPEWRLRVGDWRVRYVYDEESRSIRVLRVLPRGRAYRD
jgi:mRNA interferase RelE/StbE